MASENETKHVKRKPTRIHPINALWNMNTKVRGGDSELFVSRQPQTGVNTKSVGNSKSKIGGERLPDTSSHRKTTNKIHPINENWNLNNKTRVGGSELFLSRKPHPETNTKSVRNSKEVGNLPDISTRKIRERLIHLLGLKSQTKIELYSILQRQGLRDCERKVISTVLGDIAQFSHNSYSLRIRIWREVDVNWPYYTEKELQQMKMNKERSLRAPNKSDKVTSVPSKSSTSTSRTRPSQLDGNNTLKSSLRAPNKSDEVTSVSSNSSRSTSRTRPSQLDGNNTLKSVDVLKRPNEGKSDSQPSKKRRSDYTIESIKYSFNVFTEITNSKQYSQYKAAYDRYFEEYLPLWQQIEELKRSFREFGIQILNVPVDHPDYERKQRFDYLHAKLDHIGQLITAYEENTGNKASFYNTSCKVIYVEHA